VSASVLEAAIAGIDPFTAVLYVYILLHLAPGAQDFLPAVPVPQLVKQSEHCSHHDQVELLASTRRWQLVRVPCPYLPDLTLSPDYLSEPPHGIRSLCERTHKMPLCHVHAGTIVCDVSSAYIIYWTLGGPAKHEQIVLCSRLSRRLIQLNSLGSQ
jgi:hypothetical protein